MARTETVTFTNMCMIYDTNGNVLVQDRVNEDWPGLTFPGGHVEKGESFTDAVIREVREETGLCIESPRLCGIKDWIEEDGRRYVVLFYRTDRFTGELQSSAEGEVYWMRMEDYRNARLAEGMDKMLRVFCEEDLSEMFLFEQDGVWLDKLK